MGENIEVSYYTKISTNEYFNPTVISLMQYISSKLYVSSTLGYLQMVYLCGGMILGSPHAVLSFPWSKQDKNFERVRWISVPYTKLCNLLNSERKRSQGLTATIWQLQCKIWDPVSSSASLKVGGTPAASSPACPLSCIALPTSSSWMIIVTELPFLPLVR